MMMILGSHLSSSTMQINVLSMEASFHLTSCVKIPVTIRTIIIIKYQQLISYYNAAGMHTEAEYYNIVRIIIVL